MGAVPSAPSDTQVEELRAAQAESVHRAAAAIAQADVLLLLTGAGWSKDSGLAVYRDVADVKAYRDHGLTYADICEPRWLEENPELFYGFWGRCFNDYRETKEHEGYSIVKRWRDTLFACNDASERLAARHKGGARAFFSFTSNVDAHHLRVFDGETEVRECHGNCETFQCSNSLGCNAYDDASAMSTTPPSDTPRRWLAPSGFRFAVDAKTQLAPSGVPRQPADSPQEAAAAGFASNQPVCPRCGSGLRPSILMFKDTKWLDNPDQEERWNAWQHAVEEEQQARATAELPPLRLAILEAGAGGTVRTVRNLAECMLETMRGYGAVTTLIRINPELPLADTATNQEATISLFCSGLSAVRQIDQAMQELLAQGEAAVEKADATPVVLQTVCLAPRRVDPRQLERPSRNQHREKEVKGWIVEAQELEAGGQMMEAMELWRKAFKVCPQLESQLDQSAEWGPLQPEPEPELEQP